VSAFVRLVRGGVAAVALLISISSFAAPDPFAENVRPTEPLTAQRQLATFHVPDGFEVQLVAAEPDVHKPINIAVDARGRLWVTSTIEYPWPAKPENGKPRDAVKVIEIDPQTGRATKVTDFADGCNIPAGVHPYKNGCIAFSIPNIYYFQDTDGDGVADKRDVLYGPFDTTRDTHGMNNSFTRGYDGFLYATHGFNNQSKVSAKDGSRLEMGSGHIYRMATDGSHLDLITHGPVNPFGLCFDTAGNLYVADCHTKPIQQVLRGAWFEHFGRPHDGLGFAPRMMGHLHGSTGIAGVVIFDDDRWPAEFRGNMICGNPVTSRVNRDSVSFTGSTPAAKEMPDFVASDDPWFRPVCFAFSPDGSLYVGDFYNRIIGHYEVPLTHPGRDRERGRIWRIVPKNLKGQPAPDLAGATVDQLVKALDHPNITARRLAMDELGDRIGKDAIEPVRAALSGGSGRSRANALWVLFRLGDARPSEIAAAANDDGDMLVRAHAVRLLSELRSHTEDQRNILLARLKDDDALVRRCAADALGQHPLPENVRPLLDALRAAPQADTHLVHTLRMALRDNLQHGDALAKLSSESFGRDDLAFVTTVLPAIPTAPAATMLLRYLDSGAVAPPTVPDAIRHVCRFGGDAGTRGAADYVKTRFAADPDQQIALLKVIQEGAAQRGGSLSQDIRDFAAELVMRMLGESAKDAGRRGRRLETAADLAKTLSLKRCAEPLSKLMADPATEAGARTAAINAVLALDPRGQTVAVADLLADASQPAAIREAAARALADVNSDEARQSILKPLRYAPQAMQVRLAVALAGRPEGAATLLDAVERNLVGSRLLLEPTVKDRLKAAKVKDLDARIGKLTANLAPANADLDRVIAAKRRSYDPAKADLAKGAAVFAKTCAVCHQIDGQGAVVGPQLDGVGARGIDRLLEDVIDPNRNVDPAFRYSNITLNDGDVVSGLVKGEAGQSLIVIDSTGKELNVSKADVKSNEPSKLSLMPTGFHETIPTEDFNHLVGYLLSKTVTKQ
jgi:putative heme-binding domain-containing protein